MAEIGSVIDNKYRVLDQLARGGMSVVYLARDKRLEKLWAVKEIRNVEDARKRQTIIDSLKSEARLMKDLDHPAIVRIVDIIDEQESLYVVMDYIDGEELTKKIFPHGKKNAAYPIPEEMAVKWGIQICDVLRYLHSQKPPIIYYDLKPDNVMVRSEGYYAAVQNFRNAWLCSSRAVPDRKRYGYPDRYLHLWHDPAFYAHRPRAKGHADQ